MTPTVTIELGKLMDGKRSNVPIRGMARPSCIPVERAGIFYVLGQVGRPGGYNRVPGKKPRSWKPWRLPGT